MKTIFSYKILKGNKKGQTIALGAAGVVGALTNTVLVMGLIVVFFKDSYAAAKGVSSDAVYGMIASVIGINGIPEAMIAAIIVAFIGRIFVKGQFAKR